jgi:CRP/FNR family transcriptional regulator, cyclic AMP receptor protein
MEWGLLGVLPDADLRAVLASARRRTFERHEVVFHEADPADTVHFVAEGRLAARRSTPAGDTVTFTLLGPGDAFGELGMLSPLVHRTTTVVALEPAVTLSLVFADVQRLRTAHPAVEQLLVELLAARVARLSDLLLEALHVPADARVVRRLSEMCSRYGPATDGRPTVVPLTQTEIGDLAGASRPTTNRVLGRLSDEGLVTLRRGSILVHDPAALARRAVT